MAQQRTQTKPFPLHLRFRPIAKSSVHKQTKQQGNGHLQEDASSLQQHTSTIPEPSFSVNTASEQRRAQQIRELVRLGNLLRADLGLNEVLRQITASIATCTGFRVSIINLIQDGNDFIPVAFAGTSEEGERLIRANPITFEQMNRMMRPEFRISQSYFIPHQYFDEDFSDVVLLVQNIQHNDEDGSWHPKDVFMVPLISPREQKFLGFLSLDDPEDGKIPTTESVEVVELFANQAAIAIDNAHIFQEREAERLALEQGITLLREDIEQIQHGNLHIRVRSTHQKLQPIGDAINNTIEKMSSILGDMQMVTQAVDEHTRSVQYNSELLVRDTNLQEQQVNRISQVFNTIATVMHQVSDSATSLSTMTGDAREVTLEGQGAVDRAIEGMGRVREATLQSARTMKRLGESGQEINDTVLAITDLTTRMHLLALNAAIEAARAGEHGQGFALVAQEIRTLAMSCAEASRKVGSYIHTIQSESTAVSQSGEQTTQQVVKQTELVTQTGVALDAIGVVTEQMASLVQNICAKADNQAHSSRLFSQAVGEILRMTGEITTHTREMRQSMTHLVELTNSLRSRMSVFHIPQ